MPAAARGASRGSICLLDGSKRCEISGFHLNHLVGFLRLNGYEITSRLDDCDTVVINSCCVTESKAQDGESLVKRALRQHPSGRVILFGCLAETIDSVNESERLVFVGPKNLSRLDELFEHTIPVDSVPRGAIESDLFLPYQSRLTNDDHYLLISQGCTHACSYCNIKRAKGEISSRDLTVIIDEARAAVAAGKREIVLLADDCGSYGRDLGLDLAQLVRAILEADATVCLKLSTVFPGDFLSLSSSLWPSFATGRITYANIPVQSGSPRILSLMNRAYDTALLGQKITELRTLAPATWLYTHLLVGFPSETSADFEMSLAIARRFDEVMFITYSENPQTRAATLEPKVIDAEREERAIAVQRFLAAHRGILVDSREREPLPPAVSRSVEVGQRGRPQRQSDEHRVATQPAADPTANLSGACKGVVQLTLTNRCQCNCQHCGVKDLGRTMGPDMPLETVDRLLRDIRTAGFGSVDLFGGEPTLRRDLVDIVRLGRSHGLEMLVETNGVGVSPRLLAELQSAGIFRIYVSLDDYEAGYHDENRGRGVFDQVVSVLHTCRDLGIDIHTSIVPRSREYFLDGAINRYSRFCLEQGASRIRILFPSYVGNCSAKERIFCSETDEIELLSAIEPQYHELVYVESDFSYVKAILAGGRIPCPAKSIFCHIASNGMVMPCPYLPLAFGDATRESIIEIFARMMDHPALRQSGMYCPSRDEAYLATQLGAISSGQPYRLVESHNAIDFGAACNNRCHGCELANHSPETGELLEQIQVIDPRYGAVHLYGGELFTRDDLFELLAAIPTRFPQIIHSNARIFFYRAVVHRLSQLNVRAVKVPLFALDPQTFDNHTRVPGSFAQTVKGIENLSAAEIPVSVYVPGDASEAHIRFLAKLGVVSVSSYDLSDIEPLPDAVMCLGRRVSRTTLHWLAS